MALVTLIRPLFALLLLYATALTQAGAAVVLLTTTEVADVVKLEIDALLTVVG